MDIGDASHRNARNWPPSRISSTVFWRRTERFTVSSTGRSGIFERLRLETVAPGIRPGPSTNMASRRKETIVKDYVRERRRVGVRPVCAVVRAMLKRKPADRSSRHRPNRESIGSERTFGEADAIIAGVKYRAPSSLHFFVMTLPHSDACFVAAFTRRYWRPGWTGHQPQSGARNRTPRSTQPGTSTFELGTPDRFFRRRSPIDSLRQRQVSRRPYGFCACDDILSDGTLKSKLSKRRGERPERAFRSHYLFEDRSALAGLLVV